MKNKGLKEYVKVFKEYIKEVNKYYGYALTPKAKELSIKLKYIESYYNLKGKDIIPIQIAIVENN